MGHRPYGMITQDSAGFHAWRDSSTEIHFGTYDECVEALDRDEQEQKAKREQKEEE